MNKEIKEILDYIKKIADKNEEHLESELTHKDCALLDYITNLQEKVNMYEDPDDMTLFYMWLDEKAKDKMKQLQKENEKYKKKCYLAHKMIYDNYGILDKYQIEMLDDILQGEDKDANRNI